MLIIKKHKSLIIILLLIILISIWIILINNGEYGTTLFFSIPFTISFLTGYLNRYKTSKSIFTKGLKYFLKINIIILTLSIILILLGLEGAICIAMAYPYIVIPVTMAFIIGRSSGKFDTTMNHSIIVFLIVLNPTTYIYDLYQTPIESSVITEKTIDLSLENTREKLFSKIEFSKQPNYIFQKGVSYPMSIEYVKENDKSYYLCITNNDTIKLNIKYTKENEIEFLPERNTIPMKEITPYNSINAKHLNDYFKVNLGMIKLIKESNSKTKIIAKTNFSYRIAPKWYWKLWSDYIVDEMHKHVILSINEK